MHARGWGCVGALVGLFLVGCSQPEPVAQTEPVSSRIDALAPPNDRCSSPSPLSLGVSTAGTTVEATNDFSCGFLTGPDVFYSFTAPFSGAFRASVVAGDAGVSDGGFFFPYAYVIEGSCDAGVCRGGSSSQSTNFRANAGGSTFVVVDTP